MKVDPEVSIVDVKSSRMSELRGVEGSTSVSEKPLASATAANAAIEKRWVMQHVVRSLHAHIESLFCTKSDPGSAISTWTVEIVGHVVSRSQSGVSDERTACAEGEGTAAKR